jgi:transposase
MSRSLTLRKLSAKEFQQVNKVLAEAEITQQRRRAEAILLYDAGLSAVEIALVLGAHPNTIYADLHAFDQEGLGCLKEPAPPGPAAELSAVQIAEILRIAELPPYELGLPYGRWSLQKLCDYLIVQHVVKHLSREHLRRILKKGESACSGLSASCSVMTPNGWRS